MKFPENYQQFFKSLAVACPNYTIRAVEGSSTNFIIKISHLFIVNLWVSQNEPKIYFDIMQCQSVRSLSPDDYAASALGDVIKALEQIIDAVRTIEG